MNEFQELLKKNMDEIGAMLWKELINLKNKIK